VDEASTPVYVPASRPVFVDVLVALVMGPDINTVGTSLYPSPASDIDTEVTLPALPTVAVATACIGLSPVGALILSEYVPSPYPEPAALIDMDFRYSRNDGILLVILYP
jgi:hypothetical protein